MLLPKGFEILIKPKNQKIEDTKKNQKSKIRNQKSRKSEKGQHKRNLNLKPMALKTKKKSTARLGFIKYKE